MCKAKRQYLLTLQVSRYCILALQYIRPDQSTVARIQPILTRHVAVAKNVVEMRAAVTMVTTCCKVKLLMFAFEGNIIICFNLKYFFRGVDLLL